MDLDRPDVLGADGDDGYDEHGYDEHGYDAPAREGIVQAVLTPEALALASLVLAGVSLTGFGLLNGSPYLPSAFQDGPPGRTVLVLTALLGAALALLPLALGVWALRRLPDGSSSRTTAAAGVVVASVSVVLRLVIAARTAADESVSYGQF